MIHKVSHSHLFVYVLLPLLLLPQRSPPALDRGLLLLRGLCLGRSIIPKTTKTARLSENIDVFGFELSKEEIDSISKLNKNMRFNDPGQFCQGMGGFCPVYE